jgi:hypothetical protein
MIPRRRFLTIAAGAVRSYGPKNALDRGAQLEVVWLDQG